VIGLATRVEGRSCRIPSCSSTLRRSLRDFIGGLAEFVEANEVDPIAHRLYFSTDGDG
jgi:hypothetical protein